MEPQTFTVTEASKELGISVSTVRRWYDVYLTNEGAERTPTQERKLTTDDMQALRDVIRHRAQGLSQAAIKEELSKTVPQAAITEARSAAQGSPGEAIAPIAVVVDALRSVTAPLEARLQALEERQEAADRRNRPTWGDVIWIGVALFIAGAIMASAWTWFQ